MTDVMYTLLHRIAPDDDASRFVTDNHSDELVETITRSISYQRAAAAIEDQEGFHQRDIEFHDIIFADMSFTKVRAVIESSRANLDRARRLILTPRRLEMSLAEHERILAFIAAGDSASAAGAMRSHIDRVMAELIDFARVNPGLFADGEQLVNDPAYASFPFG